MNQIRADQEERAEDDESVRTPKRIAAILDEISRQLILISARLDASESRLYQTALIRLDHEQAMLYQDELHPVEASNPIHPGQCLSLCVSLHGCAVRFNINVEDILSEKDGTLYACRYPSEIRHLQRRDVFRVRVPIYDRRQARLRHRESKTDIESLIIDLSVKGFCLELSAADIEQHPLGSRFEYRDMILPDSQILLSGEVVLVNLRPTPKPGRVAAGFAIVNLNPQTERSLMRVALYYQREARKTGS